VSEYIAVAATAKLIRAALKKAFPAVKFSVRSSSYSGGASIRVGWMDGPLAKEVEAVAGVYSSGGFDGMIDLKYSSDEWLMPDGSVSPAKSRGTEGSMGSVPAYDYPAPGPEAKLVHFGADYVFFNREISAAAYTAAAAKVCADYGVEMPEIELFKDGTATVPYSIMVGRDYLSALVNRELNK
jgi:Large polyvalent protein associated domain 29